MKLTHSILKNLIKEELQNLLQEAPGAAENKELQDAKKALKMWQANLSGAMSAPVTAFGPGKTAVDNANKEIARLTKTIADLEAKIGQGTSGEGFPTAPSLSSPLTTPSGDLPDLPPRPGKPGKFDDPEHPPLRVSKTNRHRRGRGHRLTRKGEAILKKNGFEGFDDFYEQLRKHDLTKLLGPTKEDRKWGGAHQIAMEELKNTEKAKDAEVFKKQEDEEKGAPGSQAADKAHSVKLAGRDAVALYKELKGWGSGDAEEVLARAKDGPGLAALYDAYAHVLVKKKDTGAGDLVKWLVDDGLKEWALRVRTAVKTRKERAAEETPISGELDADDLAYKAKLEAEQEEEDTGELEENATYSSFSEHQKLFENWNRYVKSTNED